MKSGDIYWRRYKIQETLYIGQWCLIHYKVGTLGPRAVLPITISWPVVFSWVSSMVWNIFLFKGDFSFGKSQKSQGAKSGLWVAESPVWLDDSPKASVQDAMHERALSWWRCQSPVAHSCSLMNHLNSFHGGMFKLHAKFDADSLLYSLILNETATQYICSLNAIYHPTWLVQRSHHCSCTHIPVHSPWLPGYINVMQTILVILTMAGLFLDRPCMFSLK